MALFESKTKASIPVFSNRKSAFAYLFTTLIDKGVDIEEAAERANKFADTCAKNMGLPDETEVPKQGMDKYLAMFEKGAKWYKENKETVDIVKPILAGAFSAIGGVFVGSKLEQNKEEKETEKIDFDKIDNNYGKELETSNDMGGLPDSGAPTEGASNNEGAI